MALKPICCVIHAGEQPAAVLTLMTNTIFNLRSTVGVWMVVFK